MFRSRPGLGSARQLLKAKYQPGPLRDALTGVFGNRRFGESTKRLVITSYNLGADDVYLFRTAHHPRLRRDWRERRWTWRWRPRPLRLTCRVFPCREHG